MFEQISPQRKNLRSCMHLQTSNSQLDLSIRKESTMRKRLHQLMTQNFQLKQANSKLQTQLNQAIQQKAQLKKKLKIALQQMTTNDQLIQSFKISQAEQKATFQHLNQQIEIKSKELQEERKGLADLLQHNKNLQTQNMLVSQLKQKYQLDLTKVKLEIQHFKNETQRLLLENQQINSEMQRLALQNQQMQLQISARRKQIQEYESYVLEKIGQAKNSTQFHEKCLREQDKLYCKYLKYKERSQILRKERDELIFHLRQVSRQVEAETGRQLASDLK